MTWKIIYTASRQEKKIAEQLEKNKIQFYLPLIETVRLWSDRKKNVQIPLFNGYVFVKPQDLEREKILQIPGVVKFLKYNGADAVVQEHVILQIKSLIEKGYDISLVNESDKFEKGNKVEVVAGPMKNNIGYVYKLNSENFMLIEMDMMGQTIKVKVRKQYLRIIEKGV